jgi:hypothetical protein
MLHAEGSSGWISGPAGQGVERPELSRDVVLGSWSDEAGQGRVLIVQQISASDPPYRTYLAYHHVLDIFVLR